MKKIVKFGGSSLASAAQFKKVGRIIRQDENRRYVVPSAPGKRFPSDTKVTDMLYSCYGVAIQEENFDSLLENIVLESRFLTYCFPGQSLWCRLQKVRLKMQNFSLFFLSFYICALVKQNLSAKLYNCRNVLFK